MSGVLQGLLMVIALLLHDTIFVPRETPGVLGMAGMRRVSVCRSAGLRRVLCLFRSVGDLGDAKLMGLHLARARRIAGFATVSGT